MNADLMAGLGVTMDTAHRIGWGNVYDYVRHLGQGSATWRALNPEMARFSSPASRAAMLADVFDAVQMCTYAVVRMHRGKMGKPKPYPRPGTAKGGQSFGSGAVSISEFDDWYYQDQFDN